MDDALLKRFLPRFIDTARQRLQRSRVLLARGGPGDAGELTGELHTMAGEAAILGLVDIAELARQAEVAAAGGGEPGPVRDTCATHLQALEAAVATLASTQSD